MRSKKQAKQITSTIMAIVMTATTTFQMPVIAMADETTSTVAVESQINEVTEESSDVSVQAETDSQASVEATAADTDAALESDSAEADATKASTQAPEAVVESTAEVTYAEEEKSSVTAEVDPSGEDTEESDANETRGPDEEEVTTETTEVETEVETEAESTNETETEGSTEVEKADPFAALDPSTGFTEEALAAIDFSSKRLLVAADPAVIIDPEHILSSYAGVYLMQYETESQAKYAYAYYYGKTEFVDVDTVISVADGDNSANAAVPMAADENPIAELQEAVAGNPVKAAGAVAVIDTGVNGVANVTESVSMIGDNTADENGHGTKMAQLIVEQNPDVSILSIKALGADGTGDVSAVYAAIQYAIDKQVSVINLSMSALGTAENAALTSIVNEAVAAGIAVVGAAGNNGRDVRFYVPGNIASAYIIGAADENGARIASSNYGATVDFNAVAESTSEAAAKFSGYYTVNGAVADEKLVFPTDYVKSDDEIIYDGPTVKHQVSYYDYKKSMTDLVWVTKREAKTTLDADGSYFTTYIGFAEDSAKVQQLDVCVNFMDTASEHIITDECVVDLEKMTVKIPMEYKDADITVRWYMTNASYAYAYDVDADYMMADTPEPFKTAKNSNDSIGNLSFEVAKAYVDGTYNTGFTHTPASMNHCEVNYSLDSINVGNYFTINDGYLAIVDGYNNSTANVISMFGPNALQYYTRSNGQLVATAVQVQSFLTHFSNVTRDDNGADVSNLFNTITGVGAGTIHVDTNKDGVVDTDVSGSIGWVFGTCAYDFLEGAVPSFQEGGKIICTKKDADGTAYFFYYCKSERAQWAAGSFSMTPVLPKTGFLRVHKESSNTTLTANNSCYKFEGITYKVYSDSACTNALATLTLDKNGYSNAVELDEGTYYVKETNAANSGYALDTSVHTVTVAAGTTADAPQTLDTKDAPLNDPLGIVINKVNGDGSTVADLSGAEYTITYYPKEYNSLAEIKAETDPSIKPTKWVIKTIKNANGNYHAYLDDAHIVSGSAGAVFGKDKATGMYVIPLGTITVEETKAPTGFTTEGATVSNAKDGTAVSGTNGVYLFKLVDNNSAIYLKNGNNISNKLDDETAVTLKYAEVQNKSGIQIQKYDAMTGGKPAGHASLEGIKFAIVNNTGSDIINYAGQTISSGSVAQVITTNADGYAATGKADLPIGSYIVRELREDATFDGKNFSEGTSQFANEDYLWQDNQDTVVLKDENAGQLVSTKDFFDTPGRGGEMKLVKKNGETGEALAYVPFRITNTETGETHYILTDENGSFNSANHKTENTNANDAVLSKYGDHDVIPQSVINSLEKNAGIWFSSDGSTATNNYGAFVLGTYTITELKTEATKSMKMYSNTFTFTTFGQVIDLGIVNNIPMGLKTTLVTTDGQHFVEATKSLTLVDYVEYKNLDTDKTYTLTGTLYSKDGDSIVALTTETVEFQPKEANGTQDVSFTIDASSLAGKSVVAFEELSLDGEFCAEHKDKNDENQTVTFPTIKTTALDKATEDHVAKADDSVTLIDTIQYEGLQVGAEYEATGTLMDAATGKAIVDDDGNEITASKTFTASTANGSVNITFEFAGVTLAGKTVVAFEEIKYDGRTFAVHKDLKDSNQTVYFPAISTLAKDSNTGINQVKAENNATVVDTVNYSNLLPGKTYTMRGILMTSAGNALMINGQTVTSSTEFTPKTANGTVDVTFTFDASGLGGRKLVFYEYLEINGVEIAAHTDISDASQTIYVPSIKTTIIDAENGSHNSAADKDITLIDTVTYNGAEIGRTYTMTGTLVDKETQKEILDDAGKKITASTEFTAEKANGTVDVVFKFSGVSLAGKIVVAYEHMYTEGKEVAVHANLRDEGQTQYLPSVHTTATSNDTQDHVSGANEKVTITDQVSMKALKIGTEYTISGTLMDATTGKPIMVGGKTITSRRTFTADAHDMTVSLTYTLNASELAGTTTVVFENLYSDGALLAQHEDLKDDDQMVYIPKIHTTAKDKITGINHTESAKTATIIDTVFYTNLLPNRSYVVSGKLMNKATGEPILIGGKEVTASTTFTPTTAEGSVDVTFTFDATAVAPETVVVYETLTYKDIKLAAHEEISDAKQTVYIPTIKTSAISDDTKDHITKADNEITMTDTVSYKGLEVGREYQLQATLMNRATGKAITSAGKTVTASTTFTPKAKDGTVNVTFKFDGTGLEDTITVVFERLYTEGKEVAIHADLSDENQAVYLPKIRTNAADAITTINHTEAKPKAKIIDSVKYSSVLVGKEYTVTGKLVNKETGKAILVNGKEITASTTFKAEKTSGSVQVVFEFDASVLEGITVVAYESMTYKGIEVAIHADITDKDQTVYIPKVRTTAIGSDTKDHVTEAKKDVTIIDTVSYEGLEVGREYTVKGVLMNKATGKAILVNGKEVTAESTFVAKAQKGTVDVTFKFDGSSLEDTLLVAFETLYTENKEVGVHADIKDDAQTVYLPKIRTNAEDAVTEINHTEAKPKAKIIDTVSYSSLLPGKEYTLTGTLMNKATGKAILLNGKEITASTTFTAEKSSGSVQVVFEFDASILEGTTVVAYESMKYKGVEVAIHADITDKDQTVYIPKVRTTAIGSDTKDHVTEAKKDVTIIDTVSYEGLEVGREYTVKGVLMNKATGKAILVNGKEVTAESTFTAKAQKGTVDVTFKFDGSALEDTLLVAFETLYTENKEVGVHADIKDDAQTVYLPKIRTNAEDGITKINHIEAKPKATIVDSVKYSSLLPGKEYVLHGVLMDKNTGKPILLDGKEITAETTFTPKTSSGSVDVVFEFDASVLEGTTVVAYESMTYKGVEVAIHADITDKDQTVYIPKVRTTAIGSDTKDHVTEAKKDVTIIDTVSYEGLEVGREYTVKGVLMNKATGKAITVNGKEVTAESTFVAKAQKGTIDVTFKFDGSSLEDTLLVAFETLYTENKEVGVHADIKDDAQTVYLPKIRTHAKDATTEIDHTEALEKATIIDTVTYSSLLPGKEYTIKGTLMNKETGEAVLINGEPITAETTFTPKTSSGSVDLIFTFDASAIAGTTVVAFEHLEYKGIEVGVHADITDEDQTVYIPDVHTTATALDTEDHVTKANEEVTITDEVALTGLKVGSEYTVKGVLMDQTTGKELKVNDETITAEVTFTADERDMTVTLTYTLDASKLAGTTTVVYETLYTEGKEVGKHHEIKDEGQTVYIPEIHTTAEDLETKINHTEAKDQATIVDTVLYSHLLPGKEYTVKGTLMNKATGEPILINDEPITAETTFTPETPDGSVDVIFTFDATAVVPTTIVAFEHLEYKGIEVAVHADITDKDQTVYVPSIHTTAVGEDTKDHVTGAKEETTIVDTVAYKGLEVGREYRLEGTLMDQETGEPLLINDEKVTAETIFTPEEQDGSVDVIFTFNTSALAGKTLVVFETLYADGKEVAIHAEIKDEGQTVYIPEIRTTAADKETEINHTEAKEATIIDTVLYTHLLPGKEYTVKGTLMNKATGEPILIDGNEVTAETTFTPETPDGSVDVIFTFDASKIAGTTIVAFETLEYQGIEVAAHADIEDEDQTVYVPDIHTTAVGEDTKDHIEKAMEEAVIVDTVAYKGLEVVREYTVKGTLMDKETGEPLVINEEEVVAETTFTPETTDGSVDVIFTFDASALAGKTVVVFETLYTEDKEVAIHTDIEDEDQTVFIPDVYTTATDKVTGDHDGVVAEETTVLDEVFYKNLIPGKEYTVNGKLMVKETGEPLTVNGEEVTASKTFTAEEADGSVILEFTFNSLALAGKHVVAFEDLTYEGISIASHEDLEDEDQTISYPELHTNAADQASGSKTMTVGTNVTLVDTVTYKGLTKDKTYIVKGTIMDKASGQPIGVTAEATFTAEETDGSVVVTFTFDTGLLQGKTLVVFEELYDEDGNKIIAHNDLNDADQTVTVPAKEVPPVVTGDDSTPMPYVAALIALLLAAVAVVLVLVKRRKQA